MERKIKGFTLVEVIVAVALFSVIFVTVGGTFYSVLNSWIRQRNTAQMVQEARRTTNFMSNEIRHASVAHSPFWWLPGSVDTDVNGDDNITSFQDRRTWYWMGLGLMGSDVNTFYWGRDTPFLWAPAGPVTPFFYMLSFLFEPFLSAPRDLSNSLVSNAGGDPLFDADLDDDGIDDDAVILYITLRPDPSKPAGGLNQEFAVQTIVRLRN